MKQYDVYTSYEAHGSQQDAFRYLEGYALGLGLSGVTMFYGHGAWVSPTGTCVLEPSCVFRFILPDTPIDPWSIRDFAAEAKKVLEQEAVLVTVTDVSIYQV